MAAGLSKELLQGTWELFDWRRIAADGSFTHPYTERATGRIIYDPAGWMAVFLMHPDWTKTDSQEGFTAYSGRFRLDGEVVHHLVDASNRKPYVGEDFPRRATLSDGVLRLEAPASDDPAARHVLSWRRPRG